MLIAKRSFIFGLKLKTSHLILSFWNTFLFLFSISQYNTIHTCLFPTKKKVLQFDNNKPKYVFTKSPLNSISYNKLSTFLHLAFLLHTQYFFKHNIKMKHLHITQSFCPVFLNDHVFTYNNIFSFWTMSCSFFSNKKPLSCPPFVIITMIWYIKWISSL